MTDKHGHQTVVVVTGMSGAGKTTALHTLEDLGFFCVDNLPTVLAPQAVLSACESGGMTRVVLGMDVRVGTFLASVSSVLADLQDGGTRDVHVLFFDASDEALLRRFSESRRPHPMGSPQIAGDTSAAVAVLDGIRLERARLASLRRAPRGSTTRRTCRSTSCGERSSRSSARRTRRDRKC